MIELIIVMGILSILVLIAVPVYQNYAVRVRVIEGIQLASSAQTAITDYYNTHSTLPPNQAVTHYLSPAKTDNVESLAIANDGSGNVIIDYTEAAGGGTLIFTPTVQENRQITWQCRAGTLENRYRPVNCRQ